MLKKIRNCTYMLRPGMNITLIFLSLGALLVPGRRGDPVSFPLPTGLDSSPASSGRERGASSPPRLLVGVAEAWCAPCPLPCRHTKLLSLGPRTCGSTPRRGSCRLLEHVHVINAFSKQSESVNLQGKLMASKPAIPRTIPRLLHMRALTACALVISN